MSEQKNFIYGKLMQRTRKLKKAGMQSMCAGLCSVSMLKKFESGERTPNKLLRDRLFARLGMSCSVFETYLDRIQYDAWLNRISVLRAVDNGNVSEAEEILDRYSESVKPTAKVEWQFVLVMRAQIEKMRNNNTFVLHQLYLKACNCTMPFHSLDQFKRTRLSVEEISILLDIIQTMPSEHETYLGKYPLELIDECLGYIEYCDYDIVLKAKIYSRAAVIKYRLKKLYKEENSGMRRTLFQCGYALDLLSRTERAFYLTELLEIQESLSEKIFSGCIDEPESNMIDEQQYKQIKILKSAYITICLEHGISPWMKNDVYIYEEAEVFDTGTVIRQRRKTLGYTQKNLAEHAGCSEQTVRRIEKGQSDAQFEVFSSLFKVLNMTGEYFKGEIITDNPELLELLMRLSERNAHGDIHEEYEIFECIKQMIDTDIPLNRQFVVCRESMLGFRSGQLSEKDCYVSINEVLELTIPAECLFGKAEMFLTLGELICLYRMMICADENNKQRLIKLFLDIFHQQKKDTPRFYSYDRLYMLAMTWIASHMGNCGNYKDSDRFSKDIIAKCLQAKRTRHLCNNLYNLIWNALQSNSTEHIKKNKSVYIGKLDNCIELAEFYKKGTSIIPYRNQRNKLISM